MLSLHFVKPLLNRFSPIVGERFRNTYLTEHKSNAKHRNRMKNPVVRNILVVVAALLIGGSLNMLLINLSPHIIPPPPGADLRTEAGLKAAMAIMEPKHFLMPWLAHALGTLLAAFIAAKFVDKKPLIFALAIGAWFMLGGIAMIMMLPSPLWFSLCDALLAYIPMGYLGWKLSGRPAR
jgi:hypothetical protein